MYKVPIDVVNGKAQFHIKNTCAGITLNFSDMADRVYLPADIEGALTVRVELVRRSQPNAVLYDRPYSDLKAFFQSIGKKPKGLTIPFALKDNLLLNKDSYLQIDLSFTEDIITGLVVSENLVSTSTNIPISFKNVAVDGELNIDTEHYGYVLIPKGIQKIETFINGYVKELQPNLTVKNPNQFNKMDAITNRAQVVTPENEIRQAVTHTGDCGCDGIMKTQKIQMDYGYLSYATDLPNDTHIFMKTQENQQIKFFGKATVSLVQA